MAKLVPKAARDAAWVDSGRRRLFYRCLTSRSRMLVALILDATPWQSPVP